MSNDGTLPANSGPRIPAATYRLQFNSGYTFADATQVLPYLQALGISDLYASPILHARSGSTHGYDICDPTQLSPELGGVEQFDSLVQSLQERGMGLLLDTVPNHMGIGEICNRWWIDVLENGPSSPYSAFFDIEWHPIKPELEGKVLLPILEDQYGAVLESGKLQLAYEDGAFFIYYYDTKLPVAPRTYLLILEPCLARLREITEPAPETEQDAAAALLAPPSPPGLLPTNDHVVELQSILTALGHLPPRTETDKERIAERMREKEVIKRRIASLYGSSPEVRQALNETLRLLNGTPGHPRSFNGLDELLEAQVHRPAFWRVAGEEINYRRFFDINDLAAVRVEVPEVFQATHQLTLRLLQEGKVSGLRIDHPDGLWDPRTYFQRLQDSYREVSGATGELPLYVVAEKILSEREPLPRDWAVHGTTGYDFLASVNLLFVHRGNRDAFDRIYSQFIGRQINLEELTIASKLQVMRDSLSSEINALSHHLERIGERNRHYRDFTLNGITASLREVIACLPVYRTYINALTGEVPERDRKFVETAVRAAHRRRPGLADALFGFIRDTLLLRNVSDFEEADRPELANFVMKFQQLTGPVMAKGVEDTAFYVYNRLVSLNEVGSSPDQFGITPNEFHRDNSARARLWPHSLLATSTHDNKRSEDVRARINVLSEIPEAWRSALARWSRLNNSKKTMLEGLLAPDRNDEYLLYQTLVGAWPFAPVDVADAQPTAEDVPTESGEDSLPDDHNATASNGNGHYTASEDQQQSNGAQPWAERPWSFLDTGSEAAKDSGSPWRRLLPPSDKAEYRELVSRIVAYMQKAAKEAKVHTSWISPDPDYDQALKLFVERLLAPEPGNLFLDELAVLAERIAFYGEMNSLAQLLLKLTSPGAPDIYQGNELWDFSLVDPDNRRPVDYGHRRELLDGLQRSVNEAKARGDGGEGKLLDLAEDVLQTSPDGRIKLYVTWRALQLRRQHEALFRDGDYLPLSAEGSKPEYVCAFARRSVDTRAVTVVPRLIVGLTNDLERQPLGPDVWSDTWLALPDEEAGGSYRNIFTDEVLRVGQRSGRAGLPLATILGYFPVALLVRGE